MKNDEKKELNQIGKTYSRPWGNYKTLLIDGKPILEQDYTIDKNRPIVINNLDKHLSLSWLPRNGTLPYDTLLLTLSQRTPSA